MLNSRPSALLLKSSWFREGVFSNSSISFLVSKGKLFNFSEQIVYDFNKTSLFSDFSILDFKNIFFSISSQLFLVKKALNLALFRKGF